jgi:7-carboxy-7-deazaguanine synthase
MDVSKVDSRVVKILDIKTPGSAEMHRNLESNIDFLLSQDQVKFVICNNDDYLWASEKVTQYALSEKVSEVLFSPSKEELDPRLLAEWILEDQLKVRMQVQLHKYLWGDQPGH